MKKETRTYWDFSPYLSTLWILQKILYPIKICIFYDRIQKCWCREISGLRGISRDGWFYPFLNHLANYPQKNRGT